MHDCVSKWIVVDAVKCLSTLPGEPSQRQMLETMMTQCIKRLALIVVVLLNLLSSVASVEAAKDAAAVLQIGDAGRPHAPLASTVLIRRNPQIFNGKRHE